MSAALSPGVELLLAANAVTLGAQPRPEDLERLERAVAALPVEEAPTPSLALVVERAAAVVREGRCARRAVLAALAAALKAHTDAQGFIRQVERARPAGQTAMPWRGRTGRRRGPPGPTTSAAQAAHAIEE